ncbi:Wadjet anti-phage system protein JetD domain-containing protein [Sporosarcina luteola]|uniref:Wadjet anti-phage system protein JetD domain-containing protein n=1 Tax=Sporosarcina luteola TaxID=582850 RepID=UPI00203DA28E|nr:Wadjet anti-phage system protein JetD domain-containing protein [Sporosarcina luteola]MCM3709111.1 DUF2220 family protein [Sporosarcina luteola]
MYKNERMKALVINYLQQRKRVGFSISDLEDYVIDRHDSLNDYIDAGGYKAFYSIIQDLHSSFQIEPVKSVSKTTNGRKTPLPIKWRILRTPAIPTWTPQQIFLVSDRLDVSYFIRHPEQQSEATWQHVLSIYQFLKAKDEWEWESKASRCFQLFKDEKFLENEGRYLLKRLNLAETELKIRNYGEPFSYFVHPKVRGFAEIKHVLIIENLSFFHASRRMFKRNMPIIGMDFEMIIYAEGTHIELSIKYITDIVDHEGFKIFYVGDMDPAGYSIYARLKMKNPDFDITLAKPIYCKMVEQCPHPIAIKKEQRKDTHHFNYFLEEMGNDQPDFIAIAKQMWDENRRIPQEVLPIDFLLKGEGQYAE